MINRPVILEVESQLKKQDLLSEKIYWSSFETVFQEYIKDRRWFRSKARHIQSCSILDVVPMHFLQSAAHIVILQVNFTAGEPETYTIPVMITPDDYASEVTAQYPAAVIAQLKFSSGSQDQVCFEAIADPGFCSFLLESIGQQRSFRGISGEISALSTRAFSRIQGLAESSLIPRLVKAEQTNSSIIYGNQAILKLFRCIAEGVNPELEIGRFLTERTNFTNFASLLGTLEYHLPQKPAKSMAVLQSFVPNMGDAWQYSLESLERYFQLIAANSQYPPPVLRRHLLSTLREPPPLARETVGPYLISAQLMGQRTAELHKALSSVTDNPDFAPEPFTVAKQASLYRSLYDLALKTFQMLEERQGSWPEEIDKEIDQILKSKDAIVERFKLITAQNISAVLMRGHGDYHLGQILYTGKDFVIIDFEGEPARPLSERRSKISPVQDVAGMLRSFDYASQSALDRQTMMNVARKQDQPLLRQWAGYWYQWVSITFLKSYLEHIQEAHLLPEDPAQLKVLLDAYLLEKNIYEIGYELNNRPDWLKVPVHGILRLLESG